MPVRRPVLDRGRGRARRERGAVAVEAAIAFPLVLVISFAIIQGALWFNARSVALGGAQEGAREASAEQGGDGADRALHFVYSLPMSALMDDVRASQSSTETTVTVKVSADVPSVIPGVPFTVTQSATAPIERFTS